MKLRFKQIIFGIACMLILPNAHAITITSDFTGSWFNPETNGQGFQLQVLSGGAAGAFWFTFDANGNQVWALGVGTVNENQLAIQMRIPFGASFGAGFDPADVQNTVFGSVQFTFSDCNNGIVTWSSSDPQFGSGSMPIQRLTSNGDARCTGGVSDNTSQADPMLDFDVELDNLGAFPNAEAQADYRQSATRTDFDVELEDLPTGTYNLSVAGIERGLIEVIATGLGTRGEIEYSSPQDDGELLLDFEPLGELIEISQGGALLFSGLLDPANSGSDDDGNGGGTGSNDGAPPFGNSETEVDFVNTGLDADASGDAELEQRPDRVEFDVEVEDLDIGIYELWVGGVMRAEFEVVALQAGTEGEVDFRNPPEAGDLLLDFNPIGELISVQQSGSIFLEVVFPTELGGGDDDDSGGDDGNGSGGDDNDNDNDGGGDTVAEIEVDLINTGEDPDASGDAEWRQRTDRTDFSVEIEDLPVGAYNLIIGGVNQGQIDVVAVTGGTEGELEFRDPPEPGKLPLSFDPLDQLIEIEQTGVIFLMVDFPSEAGIGDDDDD